jgi:hypothetical protein
MAKLLDEIVYGERVGDLLPVLRRIREEAEVTPSGRMEFHIELDPDECSPFARALLRAEASVLLDEADSLDPGGGPGPDSGARTADALVRLVQEIGKLNGG